MHVVTIVSSRIMRLLFAAGLLAILPLPGVAQDRLKSMPGYEQYQRMSREIPGSVKLGALSVTWKDGGQAFEYRHDGKVYRYDIAASKATVIGEAKDAPEGRGFFGRGRRGGGEGQEKGEGRGQQGRGGVPRGRQAISAKSPDGKLVAFYQDANLWLGDADGDIEIPLTTDGSQSKRIKYGTASWVYGEELFQRTAMWWSPDSKRIAYYRFDESRVPDYD